jgi:hypothetical protein
MARKRLDSVLFWHYGRFQCRRPRLDEKFVRGNRRCIDFTIPEATNDD